MARKKNPPEARSEKSRLAERLRLIRTELFGERGGPELARRLGIPSRTWYNYEIGVTVPAEVLLKFLEMTRVESHWLLHGEGPKYRTATAEWSAHEPSNTFASHQTPPSRTEPPAVFVTIEPFLEELLQRLERGQIRITWERQ